MNLAAWQPASALKLPVRVAVDIVLIVLSLLLAVWPLIALVVLLRIIF
jgi:hypothetical protein